MHGRWGLGALELGAPLADLVIDKIGQRQVSTPVVDDELRTPAFLPALLPTGELTRRQCLDRAVTVIRYGAEADRFSLLDCAGAVADGALDRLSVLARPPEIARPDLPLPDEPTGSRGEWVDGVKMVPPRVLWLVSELARAFPHRALYLYSGYRPGGGRGHRGLHGDARALDVAVHGIDSRRLYEACRNLPDTGCGYYPHHPFVHVDVRRPGLVRAAWIDASAPGEPSVYVRSWPGVSDADPDTVSAP